MINPIIYLQDARDLLFNTLKDEIVDIYLDKAIYQLKIQFMAGTFMYIRYNEFGEYGYQVQFSKKKNDFVRRDNFDEKWPGFTKPHHFHTQYPRIKIVLDKIIFVSIIWMRK